MGNFCKFMESVTGQPIEISYLGGKKFKLKSIISAPVKVVEKRVSSTMQEHSSIAVREGRKQKENSEKGLLLQGEQTPFAVKR